MIVRSWILMAGMTLASLSSGQVSPRQTPTVTAYTPLFSAEERSAVMAFWLKPGRYMVEPPSDSEEKGLWQVRLTTAGSTWLLNYNRARKVSVPPTQTAGPRNEQEKVWETWIAKKLDRDRWEAWQIAVQSNHRFLGRDLPVADKTIPTAEPEQPGPIPDDLFALAGNPPPFAEAVIPMQHTIAFDDLTLTYRDNIRVSNPRYPYYRFEKGVNSEGVSMSKMTKDQIARVFKAAKMPERECRVMKAISELEGGFDAINTYDTGYISIGFIQFATLKDGANSLGRFLLTYKTEDEAHFDRDLRVYGIDVTPAGILSLVDPATGGEITGAEATKKVIEDKRLIAVFQHAGLKSDEFNAMQIKSAKSQFYPEDDALTVTLPNGTVLTGHVGDVVKSEAGIATLMDRKVNTGKIDALAAELARLAPDVKPRSLSDFAPYEYEIVSAIKYRRNFLENADLSRPEPNPRLARNDGKSKKKGNG